MPKSSVGYIPASLRDVRAQRRFAGLVNVQSLWRRSNGRLALPSKMLEIQAIRTVGPWLVSSCVSVMHSMQCM